MKRLLFASLLIGLTSPVHAHKISDHGFHCEKVIYRACKFDGVWSYVKKYTPNCDKSQFSNNNTQRIVKSCRCRGMDDHTHDYLKSNKNKSEEQ